MARTLIAAFGDDRPTVEGLFTGEGSPANGTIWRAVDGEPAWMALGDGDANSRADTGSGCAGSYEMLLDLDGTSSADGESYLLAVALDLDPGNEDEFENWYNTEHLPNLAQTPGVIRARRYRLREAHSPANKPPQYLALYEITAPEIFGNDDWRVAVNTPWTIRLRNVFHPRVRTVYAKADQS